MPKSISIVPLRFLLSAASVALLACCSDPTALEAESSPAAESDTALNGPVELSIDGVSVSGDRSIALLAGIEYTDGYLYMAEKSGVLYRFQLELGNAPKAVLDRSFGEGGRMMLPGEIRSLSAIGGDLLIRTRKAFHLLQGGELAPAPSGLGANLFAFTRDGGLGVGEHSRGLSLFRPKDTGFEATSILPADRLGLKSVDQIAITPDLVLAGGSARKAAGKGLRFELAAFSHEGELIFRIGNDDPHGPDGFAFVHDIESTGEVVYLLDSNFRDLLVVSKSGELLNRIDLHDFLGLGYSWFPGCAIGPEESMIFAVVNDDLEEDVNVARLFIAPLAVLRGSER